MSVDRKKLKLIISLMISAFVLNTISSSVCFADDSVKSDSVVEAADERSEKPRVVVSMGDSYSAGEGIEPYYGGRYSSDSGFDDWVAHRSQYSWPGQLVLPKDKTLNEYKASNIDQIKNDDVLWYFVASSGAETKDIRGEQKKTYTIMYNYVQPQDYSLKPQIKVLEFLKKKEIVPDYITLTLGGNDLGFADIVATAAMKKDTYLQPGDLAAQLNDAVDKLDGKGKYKGKESVKQKLKKVYIAINKASQIGDKKPCILVAGYPRLLNTKADGKILLDYKFSTDEAKMINDKVDYFNEAIREVVEDCKGKLDISFIDVSTEFETHEAYTENAWINKVEFQKYQDLDKRPIYSKEKDSKKKKKNKPDYGSGIASAASMHPNKEGAKCYADCVQRVINEKEGFVPTPSSTPTPIPAPTLPKTPTLSPTMGNTPTPISTPTSTPTPKPKSTKQLAYAAYLKVLKKNKKVIKAYKKMNVFSKMKKNEGWIGNKYWFGDKPILQKSSNKNCALCELTGDGVPELMFISTSKKKTKLHVYTYNSSKKKAVEILSLSLNDPGPDWYLGYSLFRTNDGKLAYFYDSGLGNGDSGFNAKLYKYTGGKMKTEKTFKLMGTSPTVAYINGKACSHNKYESEYRKLVNTTEQIIFYTVILDNGVLKTHSKKLKSVAKTYKSCIKTLKKES